MDEKIVLNIAELWNGKKLSNGRTRNYKKTDEHQKSKHHWSYLVSITITIEMPKKYVKQMIAIKDLLSDGED